MTVPDDGRDDRGHERDESASEPTTADDQRTPDESRGDDPRVPVRSGYVELQTHDGEHVRHGEAYVQYHPDAFVVSLDPSFGDETTRRFPKTSVAWLDVRHPRE